MTKSSALITQMTDKLIHQFLTLLLLGTISIMLLAVFCCDNVSPTHMRNSSKYNRNQTTHRKEVSIVESQVYIKSEGSYLPKEEDLQTVDLAFRNKNVTKLVPISVTHFTRDQNRTSPLDQVEESSITSCSPKKNIVLLKTHKTGSSTLQNILYRFGDSHDLNFALPLARNNYFCFNENFSRTCVAPLPRGYQYNVLANHARWVNSEFHAVMPSDTTYITVLRHPSTQYESLYNYYNWKDVFRVTFQDFVKNPLAYYLRNKEVTHSRFHHSLRNPSLYDLGLTTPLQGLKEDDIYEKVKSLDEEFHLVLIMEYIEESIILLKDLMCWSWDDVLYFQTNSRATNEVQGMTEEVIQRLIKWNEGDWILYRHFNETLWTKVEHYGKERMKEDIATLRRKINEKTTKCIAGTKHVTELKQITINRFQLTPAGSKSSECQRMVRPALTYLYELNSKMSTL